MDTLEWNETLKLLLEWVKAPGLIEEELMYFACKKDLNVGVMLYDQNICVPPYVDIDLFSFINFFN